jgi:capsule polysaccharide export protein KpsE/RkpR
MMIGLMLALALVADPQRRPPPPPPPPPPDVTAIAQYVARLTVLEERKQALDAQLIDARKRSGLGESHPAVLALKAQLAEAEAALAHEGTAWRENELERLTMRRTRLEQEVTQTRAQAGLGPNHPEVRALRAEIDDLTARIVDRATALLASGQEQALLAETTRKDSTGVDAFLKLAGLYAAAGRTADAERVLTDAIAALRNKGK